MMPFLTTQHDMDRVKTNDGNSHQRMGQGYPAEVWSCQIKFWGIKRAFCCESLKHVPLPIGIL